MGCTRRGFIKKVWVDNCVCAQVLTFLTHAVVITLVVQSSVVRTALVLPQVTAGPWTRKEDHEVRLDQVSGPP